MEPVRIVVGENLMFFRGGMIIVECMVLEGLPTPVVSWTKNGKAVPMEKLTDAALTLKSATVSDAGSYTCTASNAAGQMNSTTRIAIMGQGKKYMFVNISPLVLILFPCYFILTISYLQIPKCRS